MNKNLLKQYARLVAGVGINVQKGQTVVVRCPVDCADFGRALCAACFELGAKDVVMDWRDDVCSREHWLHADDSVFDAVYPWDVEKNTQLGRELYLGFGERPGESARGFHGQAAPVGRGVRTRPEGILSHDDG